MGSVTQQTLGSRSKVALVLSRDPMNGAASNIVLTINNQSVRALERNAAGNADAANSPDAIIFNATGTEATPNTINIMGAMGAVESLDEQGGIAIRIGGAHNTINIGEDSTVRATHSDVIISTAANTSISVAGAIIAEGRGAPGQGMAARNRALVAEGDEATITIADTGSIETGACLTDGQMNASTCPPVSVVVPPAVQFNAAQLSHAIFATGDNATIDNAGVISTQGADSYGIYVEGDDAMIENTGSISTQGADSHAIYVAGDDAMIDNAGAISTQGVDSYGIYVEGEGAMIENTGSISTQGAGSHGIYLDGASPILAMPTGRISTAGDSAYGITNDESSRNVRITLGGPLGNAVMAVPIGTNMAGDPNACDSALHACIDTAELEAHGIALFAHGAADPNDNLYTITTHANSRITTTADDAHGIFIGDTNDAADTAQVDLDLGGEIVVTGGVGVFIADATGAVRNFTISGRITADDTAIQDAGAATTLTLEAGADITGAINMGGGNDVIELDGIAAVIGTAMLLPGASVTGDVDLGAGNDTITLGGNLTGDITGGAGADTFNIPDNLIGRISGGAGDDHLNYGNQVDDISVSLIDADADGFSGGEVISLISIGGLPASPQGQAVFPVPITNGFSGIDRLTGGTGIDDLTGADAAATWTLGANNTYAVSRVVPAMGGGAPVMVTDTLTFSSFENLIGGSGVDTFDIAAAFTGNLSGGGGDDVFNINAALTGNLGGGDDDDTFTFQGADAANNIVAGSLTGNLDGGDGADSFTFGNGATLTGNLDGGMGFDALTGDDDGNAFFLDGMGGGLLSQKIGGRFTGIENIIGGTGADTFTFDGAFTGNLSGGGGNDSFNIRLALNGNVDGGAGDDGFDIAATLTGDVDGDGGNDSFDIAATLTGDVDGGAGDDTFTLQDLGLITGNITGGAGGDHLDLGNRRDSIITITLTASDATGFASGAVVGTRLAAGGGVDSNIIGGFTGIDELTGWEDMDAANRLQGRDVAAAWTLDVDAQGSERNRYAVGAQSLTFRGFQSLTGGTGADTFTFENMGGLGPLAQSNNPLLDGGGGTDTLIGPDNGARFTLDGPNSGDLEDSANNALIGGGGFTNIENLTGGTGADSFAFQGADPANNIAAGTLTGNITGGMGNDTFTFGVGSRIDGEIDGGAGNDHLNYSAVTDDVSITLDGSDATGFSSPIVTATPAQGNVALLAGGFSGINRLTGGTGTDSLTGRDVAASWGLAANNSSYNAGNRTISFNGFENLTGGSMADTFTIAGAYTGNLDGGGGNDAFTFGNVGSITGTLTSGAGNNTLTGDSNGNAFTLTGNGEGTLAGKIGGGFTGISNLAGGAGDDTFTFGAMGSLAGEITGGMGRDTLNYSAFTVIPVRITLSGSDATGFSASVQGPNPFALGGGLGANDVSGMDALIGATAAMNPSSLTGYNASATWTLDDDAQGAPMNSYLVEREMGMGTSAATVEDTLSFSGFAELMGGAGADTFEIRTATAGAIGGGAGDDRFEIDAEYTGDLTGGAGDDTFNLDADAMGDLRGGDGDDTFNIAATLTGGISGDSDRDFFVFGDAGEISGDLSGGAGTDVLIGDDDGNAFTISGPDEGTLADKIGGAFTGIENLGGGDGADSFTLAAGGRLTGEIDGGMGLDALTGDNNPNTFTLTGGGAGTLARTGGSALIGGFTNIENLEGGTGADTFNIEGAHIGDLTGGDGNDSFVFSDGNELTGVINGRTGTDHLNYSARTDAINVNLTGSDADGYIGGATGIAISFSGIDRLTGGMGANSLTGIDAAATWTRSAGAGGNVVNTYTVMRPVAGGSPVLDRLSFTGFQNLTGGSMADVFEINAELTGDVDGGAGDDGISIAATLTGDVAGGDGDDGFTISAEIDGDVAGGDGDDSFTFTGAGEITGTLDGGTGTDTLNFLALSDDQRLSVMMTDAMAGTGMASFINGGMAGGFTGIENLNGFLMRFTGQPDRDARWTLAAAGATYQALDASGQAAGAATNLVASVNTLRGANLTDSFRIATAFNGTLEGEDGDDAFTFEDGGSIAGAVLGGMGDDALQGDNDGNAFTLTGMGEGTLADKIAGDFTGIENLIGGAGADTFTFGAMGELTGSLDGGMGDDSLQGDNEGNAFTVTGMGEGRLADGAGNSLIGGGFTGIENLSGGAGDDRFAIEAGGRITGNLTGGDGDDMFTFEDTGEITGSLDGGMGTDTLQGDDDGNAFTLTGNGEGTLMDKIGGGFTGIENLIGGDMMDTFNITADHEGNLDGGDGGDVFNINATLTGNLDGGGGMDTFTINAELMGNVAGGDGADTFNIAETLMGNVVGGEDNDAININMGGSVMGNIDTGAGNDEITLEGNAQITGDINLGEGDDTLTFASADVRFVGLADGGAGMDTLNGLDIFTEPAATTIFRYTNFEVVNGEDELLANLPVLRMEEIETTGAMRTLIAYVDAPPPAPGMPDPDAMGGGQAPAPAMPDTDGADGDADMMGGGQPDSSAGGTDTDTDTATPTPPPPADNVQIAAELSRTYGGEITPLNADGDAPAEVEAYLFVDPTGPAAQAASVGALSTTVNTVVNQRLSGSVPGGGGSRRTARPVQLAAGALLPGLLAGGSDPLIWGELFASDRRRGRDGLNLAHGHDYRGVVFGAEQGYEGEQYRLGLLFGYADADTNTHLRSLDIETGSVFGGLYGRIAKESIDINLGLNLGYEFHDNRRYIPQLDTEAEADYNSFFINPWLGLSRTWSLQDNLELRPAFLLNYTFARYEGYEERGGEGFAIDVGSRIAHNLSTRAQVAGVWTLPDTGNELGLRLGLEGRLAGGGDFKGSLGGSSFSYSDTGDKRATSVFIGIDGRHAFSDELTLQVDVEYSHDLGGVSERTLGGFVRLEYEY